MTTDTLEELLDSFAARVAVKVAGIMMAPATAGDTVESPSDEIADVPTEPEEKETLKLVVFSNPPDITISENVSVVDTKTSDMHIFTQQQYIWIRKQFIAFHKWNKEERKEGVRRKTQQALANELNRQLKLNKSVTAYRKVYKKETAVAFENMSKDVLEGVFLIDMAKLENPPKEAIANA